MAPLEISRQESYLVYDAGVSEDAPMEERIDWLRYRISSALAWNGVAPQIVDLNLKAAEMILAQIERELGVEF